MHILNDSYNSKTIEVNCKAQGDSKRKTRTSVDVDICDSKNIEKKNFKIFSLNFKVPHV